MKKRNIGKNIIKINDVDSTNKFLVDISKLGKIKEGTVIFARHQYSGKGQGDNFWESEADKNLTISIIIYPYFLQAKKQFLLNKVVSLAVYDYVKTVLKNYKISIKWPNDVYIGKKKVAGILINNYIRGDKFVYSIVGIGLNINQTVFKSNAPNPISLKNVTDRDFDVRKCLNDLLLFIENRYSQLKDRKENIINYDYINSLFQYNSFNKYKFHDKIIEAKIIGVSEFGKLILENRDSKKFESDLKEIVFII